MHSALAPTAIERPAVYALSASSRLFTDSQENEPDERVVRNLSSQTDKNRLRALVVDDAPDVTEMIALFLQHAGYETVMAFSAPDALEAARAELFDVIVSDIGMPGMNGYELAEALRGLPDYVSVPMIAVTGFSAFDDRRRALASGFNAHLTKPINPMSLLELIERLRD